MNITQPLKQISLENSKQLQTTMTLPETNRSHFNSMKHRPASVMIAQVNM